MSAVLASIEFENVSIPSYAMTSSDTETSSATSESETSDNTSKTEVLVKTSKEM